MDSNHTSPAEITLKAVVLGVILAMILGAANAYLGLYAGMTVSASIPAAVVSMGLLRFFRKHNILENNIVQTAASAGESLAAGVIFTLPALLMLGFWTEFHFGWVALIAGFGGILGVLFTIPLRRSLIVEGELQYPEGIATAEVLETGRTGGAGVRFLIQGGVVGGLFKLASGALGLWPGIVEGALRVRGSIGYFGGNLSPMLVSVGYIVGLNIAILIFLGGAANWLVAIPLYASANDWPLLDGEPMHALEYAQQIWSTRTRYIGVGAMLVGGLWTIFKMRRSLLSGVVSGLTAYRQVRNTEESLDRTERDIPMNWILALIVASIVPLYLVYQHFIQDVPVSLAMAVIMLFAGFVFSAVAGYMAGLVGSSNNPISGVTIATVVVTSLLLVLLMGRDAAGGPAAAIIVGAVVCCAAAIAGDNMQDLKAGRIVGATPWKQQIMQLVGTTSGALVIAPVLLLLQEAYGFAGMEGASEQALKAPQAFLMASVAKGVFTGELPWSFVYIGIGVAILIIMLDVYLEFRKSEFRTPVLAVAIGIYLPFELAVPIFLGGLIHWAVRRWHRRNDSSTERIETGTRNGLLIASGLITGEALMGILLAIPIVILAQRGISLPLWSLPYGAVLGILIVAAIAVWLYKAALKKTD